MWKHNKNKFSFNWYIDIEINLIVTKFTEKINKLYIFFKNFPFKWVSRRFVFILWNQV